MPEAKAEGSGGGPFATLRRYGIASFSSALVSVGHLLIQLLAVRQWGARDIGVLAFMMVIITFGYSLSNAMICTPYAVNVNHAPDRASVEFDYFFKVNALLCVVQALICAGVALTISTIGPAICFGIAAGISLLRWFGRAYAYAEHRPARAALSDLIYSAIVVGLVLCGWLLGSSLILAGVGLAIAGTAALVPFGAEFLRKHAPTALGQALKTYRPIWKEQSAWTLTGVVSTEATANSHAYIVTAIAGPSGFAPIAIAQLFFRPVAVCVTALTQLERPRMARAIGEGDYAKAITAERHFLMAVIAAWTMTAIAVTVIITEFPHLISKPSISFPTVVTGVLLCAVLTLIQCTQAPASVLIQSRGEFKKLAFASVFSSGIGVGGATLMCLLVAPVWSLAGVALAQFVLWVYIRMINQGWKRTIREPRLADA